MNDYSLHLNLTQDIGHGITLIFMCFVIIFVAVGIDFSAGYKAAKICREPIKSRLLRRTVSKITDYYRFLLVGILVDVLGLAFPWYSIPFAAILVTLAVVLIEGWSVVEKYKKIKSAAAEIPDMISKIVNAATSKDAEKIIKLMNEYGNKRAEE